MMKLLFKQRIFSWLDSYDIYNENQEIVYTVEGKLSWGHRLVIYDAMHEELGEIKEEMMTFLPKFNMYYKGTPIGMIKKELTFLRPKFHLDCNDWKIVGDYLEWDYEVESETMGHIMSVSKEIFHFSDTYVLDIDDESNALYGLMIVLAIDAAKCSQRNG